MLFFLVIIASVLGGIIQSMTGFGAGVIMMLFFERYLNMLAAPALSSSICTGLTIALFLKFRKYVCLKKIVIPTAVYVFACTIVISLVKNMNLNYLQLLFGLFLIAMSIYSGFFAKRISVSANTISASICALLSGICGGLFGVGGPPLALYFLSATSSKEEYIGTIQAVFMLTSISSLVTRICNNIYTPQLIIYTIIGIIFVNIGKILGLQLLFRFDEKKVCTSVYICIGVSGLINVLSCL